MVQTNYAIDRWWEQMMYNRQKSGKRSIDLYGTTSYINEQQEDQLYTL